MIRWNSFCFMLTLVFTIQLFGGLAIAAAPHEATDATKFANAAVLQQLPFNDRQDFEFAQRGFIARPKSLIIKDVNGKNAWNMDAYNFIGQDKPSPDTVNPSLWRNAQINTIAGLFKVSDRIFQVRGYDLSNITFIQGDTGWIVFDPLISAETARAAYDLVTENLGKRPVVAVVYSHSHVDHFGGVRGVVNEADVKSGKVRIFAPEGFMEHAVSENVTAGNAMSRRSIYMYGALLPRNEKGGVNAGLGQTTSQGTVSLLAPTDTITKTGQLVNLDGIDMIFHLTPGTEAPVEMNTWFPQFNALWMAENCTATLHNLYTLRGAEIRDGKKWAYYVDEALDLYGKDAQVVFQSHHWPRWGNAYVVDYMQKTRDGYKYIHDQTVRLMNHGYTSTEIAEMLEFPAELNQLWYLRGYYGTVKHNAKAVYQKYLGWYDANPANLDPLPPEPAAKKFVEYMGGSVAVIEKARKDFADGNYRWVAQIMNQVVFADPNNKEARELEADALEQLGYQAESGPWRSVYLQGAYELRNGLPNSTGESTVSADILRAMSPEMLFDYLAIRLNGPKASGKKLVLNFNFPDLKSRYVLTVENGVLNYVVGRQSLVADATITTNKETLDAILVKQVSLNQKMVSGEFKVEGNKSAFTNLFELLDNFPFWFNIVTP